MVYRLVRKRNDGKGGSLGCSGKEDIGSHGGYVDEVMTVLCWLLNWLLARG